MITENEYLILKKALSILNDYLLNDDSNAYPDGIKESYSLSHSKAEDILRNFENERGI
jgi:hypothetical protein